MDRNLFQLLKNYLTGKVTPEDREQITDWYNSLNKADARFKNPFVKRRVKENLWAYIQSNTGGTTQTRSLWGYWSAAVAIVLIATTGILYFAQNSYRSRQQQTYLTMTVPVGETKNVRLADGSEVYLNSGASFSYPAEFSDTARQVRLLRGEAFFSVAKNPKKPFRISSGKITTTVLGTSFNIRTLKRSGLYQIKVMTGKVKVTSGNDLLATLIRNKGLNADLLTGRKIALINHHDAQPSWMSGTIQLESASFNELADVMEQYYGVQLHSTDTHVLNGSYSLTFNRKDKSDTVMEIISSIKRMEYERKGNQVIIK